MDVAVGYDIVSWRGNLHARQAVELVLRGRAATCGTQSCRFSYQYSVGERVAIGDVWLFSRCVRNPEEGNPTPKTVATGAPQFHLDIPSTELHCSGLYKASLDPADSRAVLVDSTLGTTSGPDSCNCLSEGGR